MWICHCGANPRPAALGNTLQIGSFPPSKNTTRLGSLTPVRRWCRERRSNGLVVPTSNGRTERQSRQAPPQNPCSHACVSQSTKLPISGLDPEPSEALRFMACFSTSTALLPAKLSRASPGFEKGSRSVTRTTALPLILPQLVISQRHQSSHSLPLIPK